MDKWKEIWNKRVIPQEGKSLIEKLMRADGYDSGAGFLEEVHFRSFVHTICSKLHISLEDTVYEVGCGSGAFLFCLYEKGHIVAGLDYSDVLIKMARKAMPEMELLVAEAIELETFSKYDFIFSNGVFHYFPDLSYAGMVIEKMFNKANKTIAILDVPDIASKEESEKARQGALGKEEYLEKYDGLAHTYYSKDWFSKVLNSKNYRSMEIFNQNIEEYGNNDYRFNVVINK